MPGFQTSVGAQPAPGIEGGFHGANPHFTLANPNEGGLTVGSNPPFIGRFGFVDMATGLVTANHPGTANARVGFVHRDQPVFITGIYGQTSMLTTPGREIDLLEDGPVWGRFAAGATPMQKVYASYVDGSLRSGVTGQPASSAGITATTTSGSPNLTNVAGGTLAPGQPVSGAGIPAGAYIQSVSGSTAVMSANATAGASGVAVTASLDFETDFRPRSYAGNGELAKISVRG